MKTTTITQTCILPGSPSQVFELLMDEQRHAAFTGGEAKISRRVGGAFVTFDGWATGKNISLVSDRTIVQTWRGEDWPPGHFSTITFKLTAAANGTKIEFTQSDVPLSVAKDVAAGWKKYYWIPMRRALA